MANELIYRNPNTGELAALSTSTVPSLNQSDNGAEGNPAVEEYFLQLQATIPVVGTTVLSKQNIQAEYQNAVGGGEFIPNAALHGKQAILAADITSIGTSITVEKSTTNARGIQENIFVADRPYLLMNRLPEPGESVWDTGLDENGMLKPAAEVIIVDSGYTSGTTITIARPDANAAARSRFAIIQEIVGVPASYGDVAQKGIRIEMERPDAVVMTDSAGAVVSIDGGAQTIDVRFVQSLQQADTARSSADNNYPGAHGVVTHYGVWCVKQAGAFLNAVRGIPEACPPETVVALASLTSQTVNDEEFLEIAGVDEYWDPSDSAMKAITAGTYWVAVRAMNQATFDEKLRISNAQFVLVDVA